MGLTILTIFAIGVGLGYWAYKCQQKNDCSFTGECKTVLKHLDKGLSITQEQAKKLYDISHLRSVISRLRHKHKKDIATVMVDKKAVYKKK